VHSRLNREQHDFIVRVLDTFQGSKFIGVLPAVKRDEGVRIMDNETVLIQHTTATRETDKAILVKFADGSEHWIPKSQLQPGSEVRARGDEGDVVISQWFADNSNLFGKGKPAKDAPAGTTSRALENRPGHGVLFTQRAEGAQPSWRGGVNIDGVEYKLAGWIEQSKSGVEYVSLAIERDLKGERAA
jgi:hypothetical protein